MEIIPAIDIKEGTCVRLYQGDFDRAIVYDSDPIAVAKRWVEQGAQRLQLIDLDGARAGHPVNTASILGIMRAVDVPVQLGGGLRTESAVRAALNLGVSRVILGTAAVYEPHLIERLASRHGDAIIVGVDARDGIVATDGWTEASPMRAIELVEQMATCGIRRIIYTDITRDGTLSEPNFAATFALVMPEGTGPAVIAAGGICKLEHVRRLARGGVEGAVIGRALYTGDLHLQDMLQMSQQHAFGL
ncbi:MAG TPA: 1-(5-phosphoribosyl)-5-[(5-phosphoribosylamino)methylideneamino]imidazole-4-carboxamide isomerase [Roseiflexaceae bacterium]|jgi:phosphoribosylformimino-5-aminoimidazole carboxamide ribotide isomerase|nr:1-(5-phosphoribosyl)-5-[(5-phosphoribosylamino)methylideneamino]imidazole-4-carboxamide isomerase [Roseiflexaceae bacterium]